MRSGLFPAAVLSALCLQIQAAAAPFGVHVGWSTNPPAVFDLLAYPVTNRAPPLALAFRPPPTNLPPEIQFALTAFLSQASTRIAKQTNWLFDHYFPESLNHLAWTNVIARTNGRSPVIWNLRVHPPGWPATPPQVRWNTNGLMWGMRGLTALSPCWEGESLSGQVPITALTRRHGYTRGHSMGPEGFHTRFAGQKVWFVTLDDQLVERTIVREVVRTVEGKRGDYTILLFNQDLPEGVEPIRVSHPGDVFGPKLTHFVLRIGAPLAILQTEQGGCVSAGIPGFTVNIWKGGDSGSPNMLPLADGLMFFSGRSTSGASPAMQADMDELCRLESLDLSKYQLQWVDLSSFPSY